jgi:adenylosuccinate lyase
MNTETTTHTTATGLDDLTKIINAVALHASTDRQRYALCGIYITAKNITATDSYTMTQYTPAEPITIGEPVLIDARELTTALNNLTRHAAKIPATATLTANGQTWTLTATTGSNGHPQTIATHTGQTMNAEHPNTQQLLDTATPATTPHEPTGYNPDYLERITKASRKLSKHTPLIMAVWQTPSRPVIYTTTTQQGQLLSLIMPQRINPTK